MTTPDIRPYNAFDPTLDNQMTRAVKIIATVVTAEEWVSKALVVKAVIAETGLAPRTMENLLVNLRTHGDLREHNGKLKLTTRWLP